MGCFDNSCRVIDSWSYKDIFPMIMAEHKLLIGTEIASLIALALIFFKVFLLAPNCFSVRDTYFTIVPLFMTKMIEFKLVVMKK